MHRMIRIWRQRHGMQPLGFTLYVAQIENACHVVVRDGAGGAVDASYIVDGYDIGYDADEAQHENGAVQAILDQSQYGNLQRVGTKYWDACTDFANIMIAGNPNKKSPSV